MWSGFVSRSVSHIFLQLPKLIFVHIILRRERKQRLQSALARHVCLVVRDPSEKAWRLRELCGACDMHVFWVVQRRNQRKHCIVALLRDVVALLLGRVSTGAIAHFFLLQYFSRCSAEELWMYTLRSSSFACPSLFAFVIACIVIPPQQFTAASVNAQDLTCVFLEPPLSCCDRRHARSVPALYRCIPKERISKQISVTERALFKRVNTTYAAAAACRMWW